MDDKDIIITTLPKVIHWVEIPSMVNEDNELELLKRDILVLQEDGDIENIEAMKKRKTKRSRYFFNLDNIISRNRYNLSSEELLIHKLIEIITHNFKENSIVHTSIINQEYVQLFLSNGIPYIEKNLQDNKIAYKTVLQMIKPLYLEQNKIERSCLRINFYSLRCKVELDNLSRDVRKVHGILRDISINSIGIVLNNKMDLNYFQVKDSVKLSINLKTNIINITMGIVSRVDEGSQEIGVCFDITNTNMINSTTSDIVAKIILTKLKKYLKE